MTQDGKRAAVEGDREDRISGLQRNVIDHILELLPVQDAAKSSILSRNWRYVWATPPNLVLGYCFCRALTEESESDFEKAVDEILLLHMGDIVKFVLDARGAHLSSFAVIHRWVLYVTRNGVKKLTLRFSNLDTYTLPSCIFHCSTLTQLELFNCVFKSPISFLGFQNLINLRLEETTFVPTTSYCVIKAPRLANLTLDLCHGTQYLTVVSLRLNSFYVRDRYYYLLLNCFINCKNLRVFELGFDNVVNSPKHNEKSSLENFLVTLPALEVLDLDSYFVELLSADVVPNGLPVTLNCLWHLFVDVNFCGMGPISSTLQLIKNSPNLSKLEISVRAPSDNAEAVWKYLDTPSCLERPLDKLEHVYVMFLQGSKTELLFVKLLLSRAPSLLSMRIDQYAHIDADVALELKRFRRASPRAELFYSER